MLELRAGLLVDDEGYVGMELQRRGGDTGRDRTFDGLRDGSGFGWAAGEEKDAFRIEDSADAHGDSALGDFLAGREKFAIVVDGFFAEDFQARAGTQAGGGLVETDVAVAADAQDLKIDAASVANGLLVRGAVAFEIGGDGAVGDVNVRGGDVHVREEMLLHEMMEALSMIGGEAEVFVEIEGDHARKIEGLLAMQAGQLFVHFNGGAAGGETQAQLGISADGVGDNAGGFAAEFLFAWL